MSFSEQCIMQVCEKIMTVETSETVKRTDIVWYALRITYSREVPLKEFLDERKIENFLPMHYRLFRRGDKEVRKLVPVVHNLIFVRSSRTAIDEIKAETEGYLPLRYLMDRATHQPIIVPGVQMKHFIAVAGTHDDQLLYIDPATISLKRGDRVRITGGMFEGVEGEFLRVKGDRRVVVSIQGIMAVATTFIHPSLIQVIR